MRRLGGRTAAALLLGGLLASGGCSGQLGKTSADEAGAEAPPASSPTGSSGRPGAGSAPTPGPGGTSAGPTSPAPGAPATSPPPAGSGTEEGCVTIRPVSPTVLGDVPAGPGQTLRLYATSLLPPEIIKQWRWSAHFETGGVAVTVTRQSEPWRAELPVERPGRYVITLALETTVPVADCSAQVIAAAREGGGRVSYVRVRATPPAARKLPVQEFTLAVESGQGATRELALERGIDVLLDPLDETGREQLPSYVRVSQAGRIVFEGHTDGVRLEPRLLETLFYDVLLVPDRAVAPVLHTRLSPGAIGVLPMRLAPGHAVEGTVLDAAGAPVRDASVVLRDGPLTSTLARSDAAGLFTLRVRDGRFQANIAPPPSAGLVEAVVAGEGIPFSAQQGAARLEFRWAARPTGTLSLLVRAAGGDRPPAGTRVRVESEAPLRDVGRLRVLRPGQPTLERTAEGLVRATAGVRPDGAAELAPVPVGRYRVTLVPPDDAADTVATHTIEVGPGRPAAPAEVRLGRRVRVTGAVTPAGDLAGARVIAYDEGSDLARPPAQTTVGPDGRFSLAVEPGRPLRIEIEPGPGRPFPRTVLERWSRAPGADASLPPVTVARGVSLRGRVVEALARTAVPGTVLQVYCTADCPAGAAALAEGTVAGDGAFELVLPDLTAR